MTIYLREDCWLEVLGYNPSVMPQYSLFVCSQDKRIRYPKTYDLPDVEAARQVALRVAKVFMEVVPYWNDLSPEQQDDFVIQIDDESSQTVLIVPFRDA
jgi:hypothetical protein